MSAFAGVSTLLFFCTSFLRNIFRRASSAWSLGRLLPRVLSWRHLARSLLHGKFPWTLSRRFFRSGCFRERFRRVFFACPLSQSFFRGFSRGFFPRDLFRALLCVVNFHALFLRASSACTFARILIGISLGDVLRDLFRMDNFHGFFREGFSTALLYSGYLRALFRGGWFRGFFAVASSVQFFAGIFPRDFSW